MVAVLQHLRHLAVDDLARQALRRSRSCRRPDRRRTAGCSSAGGTAPGWCASTSGSRPISGSILPSLGLLVEVDAIGVERVLRLLLALVACLGVRVLVDAAHVPRLGHARPLGDAVADVLHRVVARHVLLLQEIGGMALALGEDRDQHVGAGDLLAAGGLHVHHGALDDALEAGGRLRFRRALDDQRARARCRGSSVSCARSVVEVDVAGPHDRRRRPVVDQREQQVLERRVFVAALVGVRQRAMQGAFETVWRMTARAAYSFSMVHCRGCWCWRAKSITCVTLVSATS